MLGGGSLLLATLAHVVAGGRLPGAWVLALSGLLLGVVAVTLTARRCRFPLVLAALTLQQVLLHLVFDAASSLAAGCNALPAAATAHAAHGVGLPALTQGCGMSAAMGHAAPPGWAMWAAHLAATVLTAALLTRGEAWLWRATDRFVAAATAAPGRYRRPAAVVEPVGRTRPVLSRRVPGPAAPRGPPQPCAAA